MTEAVLGNGYLCSIVVPVFNTPERLLRRCLSIFVMHRYDDLEIMLCDDGSNDQTVSLLYQLAANSCTRMQVLAASVNAGQNSARNRGVTAGGGKYVMFLDSDDYFDEGELRQVLQAIRRATADAMHSPDMFVYGCKTVDDNMQFTGGYSPAGGVAGPVASSLVIRNVAELWGCVTKRDLLVRHPLHEGVTVGEDLVSLIPIVADAESIVSLPFSPYRYVQRNNSVMHSVNAAERLQIIPAFQSMLENMDPAVLSRYRDELEWQAIWHILFWEPFRILQGQTEPDFKLLSNGRRQIIKSFPHWKKNPYLNADPKARGVSFRLIVQGHYRFYRLLYISKRKYEDLNLFFKHRSSDAVR